MIAYRHAAYDTPWWAFPSSRHGRFHRATRDTVQYLSLHPLGPAAEFLRHNVGPLGDPDHALVNLWAADVDVDRLEHVTFDNCDEFGITADELVGDDYRPTQGLSDGLRGHGVPGIRVPSAALPGTENVVVFGARVLQPYMTTPASAVDVPTGHLTDGARPPAEVASMVRWFGTPHTALEEWKVTGKVTSLQDPRATRW